VVVAAVFVFVKVGESDRGWWWWQFLRLWKAKGGPGDGVRCKVQHPKRKMVQVSICLREFLLDCLHRGIGSRFVTVNVKSETVNVNVVLTTTRDEIVSSHLWYGYSSTVL